MRKRLLHLLDAWGFLLAMAGIVALAHYAPQYGLALKKHYADKIAIVGFFLLNGLTIRFSAMHWAPSQWRCHATIQALIFLVAPALVFVTAFWMEDGPLKYGVFMVAALPTTVASATGYTLASRGDGACAMLSSVTSNFIGILLSPLVLGLMIGRMAGIGTAEIARTVLDMSLLVIIPYIIGQSVVRLWPVVQRGVIRVQRFAAQALVLFVTYCALCASLGYLIARLGELWLCFLYLGVAHIVLVALAFLAARIIRAEPANRSAIVFCGSQKTLAFGIPFVSTFFGKLGMAGDVVMVPLIFYYIFQLVGAAVLVRIFRSRYPQG